MGSLVVAQWLLSCGTRLLVAACMWDLVPWPGIEPRPPALGTWSLIYCSIREVPFVGIFLITNNPISLQAVFGQKYSESTTATLALGSVVWKLEGDQELSGDRRINKWYFMGIRFEEAGGPSSTRRQRLPERNGHFQAPPRTAPFWLLCCYLPSGERGSPPRLSSRMQVQYHIFYLFGGKARNPSFNF